MGNIIESPRYSCTLGGALATVRNFYRTIPILHAGPGCGPQVTMGQSSTAGYQGVGYVGGNGIPSTNMYEKEVIFGGEDRLREIIQSTTEIMEGDFYFVLTGCTSDIIGDDVEAIVGEYRQKGIPVGYAETAGFKGNSYYGYELVFEALARQVVKPHEKDSKLVNLFGIVPYQDINWQGNIEEISRLLKKLGLNVNTFLSDKQGLETIQSSSKAALNIILSPWLAEKAAEIYEEVFDVPYLRFPGLPIGPSATSVFIRKVGDFLQLDKKLVEKVIIDELDYVYHYFERLTEIYVRYNFAIIGDSNNVLGFTKFLAEDFGQIPVLLVVTDSPNEKAKDEIIKVLGGLEYVGNPKVVFTKDQWEIKNEIIKAKPTYILGSSLDKEVAQELSVPFQSVSFPVTDRLVMNRAYAGYRGSITLVEDLFTPR